MLGLAGPAGAETIRLGGTGAALGVMKLLGDAYKVVEPSFQFEVVPNLGSRGGIKAIQRGAIQIAVIARAPKSTEKTNDLRAYGLGRTPFVLSTAKEEAGNLTLEQIAEIYAGRVTRWEDGGPVRLVLRPANDGDTTLLASFSTSVKQSLAIAMSRDGMVMGMTDQDAVDAIERLQGGLGTTTLALLISEGRRARALSIDGIAPTPENVANGRYPYAKPLILLVRKDSTAGVNRFGKFIRSDAGGRVLSANGIYVTPMATETSAVERSLSQR